MMIMKKSLIVLVLGLLGVSSISRAQATSSLASSDWRARSAAFKSLNAKPNSWRQPGMAAQLVRLYERESALVTTTLRESNGERGVSDELGEGFGEYLNDVFEACMTYCERASLLDAFLKDIQPSSEARGYMLGVVATYATQLFSVEQRERIDGPVLQAMRDTSLRIRYAGVRAISEIVKRDAGMTSARREAFHRAVLLAATDPSFLVRRDAVQRIGLFRDTRDTALLKAIAASDTTETDSNGRKRYPVRDEAQKALQKIRPPM
jgi:hypothetical protein